jgi:hypothetical protein
MSGRDATLWGGGPPCPCAGRDSIRPPGTVGAEPYAERYAEQVC